ncbi:15-hydroxyprostaglandin dehydrogenase [NAD(+)] [Drechslerella dactyloides]|uniref:15-hydroxyprostaglandin dehydrogenase [NAD(+)] n=1 Tax=Drechslerella dactyloides TaxID=74499 RepID=A0AAD6NFQ9_DREDA|nr:15-hydroxyprostaglandin dehydrogenase [NAD(+)] [Drechslerella dactyloides]
MKISSDSLVAIVTGGASGIGLGIATHLVAKGWNVVLADVNPSTGVAAAEKLGSRAVFHHTDVSSWDSQVELFKTASEKFGRLDFFAANAGIDDRKSIYEETQEERDEDQPAKPYLKVVEVDFIAVVWGVKLASWYMRRNPGKKGGCIVITSSDVGLYPMATNPLYASCKAALVNFTRSVAETFREDGIRVNAICPGLVPTAIFPGKLTDFFPEEYITPVSTIVAAYDKFITDETLAGKVVECSQDRHFFRDRPEYPNESQRWMHEESGPSWAKAYKAYFESKL